MPNRMSGLIAMAMLLAGCSSTEPGPTSTELTEAPVSGATVTTATETTVPAATTSTTTITTTTSTTTPPGSLPDWDSWTLVYASLETDEHMRVDADGVADGIEGANVLLSDQYPSLNPGYWVVYAGSWGSRSEASGWCPPSLDPGLTCYPRYLGDSIPRLLAGGAALAELADGRLVVMEPDTAEVLATFDNYFSGDGRYPSYFNLGSDFGRLYFGVGFEDSWYTCQGERGTIRSLDLNSGTEQLLGDGWSPSLSPDGRWLAIVAADQCYPDPEVSEWFVAPGSQVELYDLSDADNISDHVLRTATLPTSYDDPDGIRRVMWDPASDRDLLVTLADGSVRRIAYNSDGLLDAAELVWASEVGEFAAATASHSYLVEWDGESTLVSMVARLDGDTIDTYEIDGWVTGFALGRSGEVIVTTWEYLILPNGERIPVAEGVSNLAW